MVSTIKKIILAAVLLMMGTSLQAQKKWFDEALKNGRRGEFYKIENPKKKDLPLKKCKEYAYQMDYVLGEYTLQEINKFGKFEYVVETFEFLPRNELYELVYNALPKAGKIPFAELKRGGQAYYFRGIEKGVRKSMDSKELEGRVNLSYLLNQFVDWHYFEMTDTLLWSGEVKDGMIDGSGTAFYHMTNDIWLYFQGTFDRGFPVGECTVYRYVGSWNKCCNDFSLYSQTCRLSGFENGFATFEVDGYKGFIDRSGTGDLTPEQKDFYRSHAVAYHKDGAVWFHYFDAKHTNEDRIAIGQIMKDGNVFENGKLLISNKLSIPQFYKEELSQVDSRWSRERLQEVMKELKRLYDGRSRIAELDTVLYDACRREGMLYEYAMLTKNPTLLTDKELSEVVDSMFFNMEPGVIAENYLLFFRNGKYKGKDIKEIAERTSILYNKPQVLKEKYAQKYAGKDIDEMWVQAYIDNAHDMLERNDENLWTRCIEGDVTKYPILVEGIGRYRSSGGMFGTTFYCFYGSSLIKWHNEYFEIFERKGVKNIEEAKKYKTLLEGIAIANQGKSKKYDYIDNSEYVAFTGSNFDQKMGDAIRVAREFAVSKPELAPACGKADSIINLERNRIYQGLGLNSSRVEGDHQRWKEKKCEGCRISLFENPSSNSRGYIRLYNDETIEWYYEKGKIVVLGGSNYGGVQEYMSVEEMKSDIIKRCKENYCN